MNNRTDFVDFIGLVEVHHFENRRISLLNEMRARFDAALTIKRRVKHTPDACREHI